MEKHFAEITEKRRVFFDDFISHYNILNRGVKDGNKNNCSYASGCAIGRVIDIDLALTLDEDYNNPSVINIFRLLPLNLQELGSDFLQDIQNIHDCVEYWQIHGLSALGEVEIEKIKEKWAI